MMLDSVRFEASPFDVDDMTGYSNIVVNSDMMDWVDSEECIVINTWNYRGTSFGNNDYMFAKACVTDTMKILVEEYVLATRIISDMIYSSVKLFS